MKIFAQSMKRLGHNQYEKVQVLTKGKCYNNATFDQCTKKVDFDQVNGENDKILQKMTNHPVHILDEDGSLAPTALIPFCEFGGNMSVMGIKIDQFNIPICNSFKPKIIRDQLCYTVDPNEYKDKIDLEGDLSLTLFIHYNEDRQLEDPNENDEHFIIVDTIGT